MKQAFLILTAIFAFSFFASAQTTAFNFQGRLNDGTSPANGRYDLEFRLYDGLTGDAQIGATIAKPNLMLVNGVFSTQLDFGAAAFNGADRFIEIRLRATGSNNGFVVLGPRQQVLSVPFTIRSNRATLADDATHATNADSATTATNALNLGGTAAANYLKYDANGNVNVGGTQTAPAALASRLYVEASGGQTTSYAIYAKGAATFEGKTVVKGDFSVSGQVVENLSQPLNKSGLPKAMLKVNADGTIANCYNGITGAATGNCGFTVDHFTTGGYGINFGFGTDASFVSLAVQYDRTNSEFVAANYSTSAFFGHLDVYTFRFPNAFPTTPYDRPFTIILY